jgi:hypothetical protein
MTPLFSLKTWTTPGQTDAQETPRLLKKVYRTYRDVISVGDIEPVQEGLFGLHRH